MGELDVKAMGWVPRRQSGFHEWSIGRDKPLASVVLTNLGEGDCSLRALLQDG